MKAFAPALWLALAVALFTCVTPRSAQAQDKKPPEDALIRCSKCKNEGRIACGRHFDGVTHGVADSAMRLGHGSRRHRRPQQAAQTNVEIIHPGEVVKNALVDTQTPPRNAG